MRAIIAMTALLMAASPQPAATAELADLVEQVAPSVVNIHTSGTVSGAWWDPFGSPFGSRQWTSLGSGFVVDPDGLVVTNHHVVQAATTIRVGLVDGTTYDAAVVGVDPASDLALLSVDARGLPAVTLDEAGAIRVGEDVFAVGNPYGFAHTVTAGIVSALHRDLELGPFDDFLQTDASINPGNSGGPLFDMQGRVVGVNTAIHGGEGLGFAVPVQMLLAALPHLRAGGEVERGWAGVSLRETDEGVAVVQVFPQTPAAEADLETGDVVLSVDGRPLRDGRGWSRSLGASFAGDEVTLRVRRGADEREVTLALVDHDEWSTTMAGPPLEVPAFGIAVRPPAPDRLAGTGLETGVGLEVVEVSSKGGSRSFFREGDVIIEINGNVLRDPMDLPPLADQVMEKRRLQAVVLRDGSLNRLFYRF